jgi:HK97 family phage portal protein
MWRLMPQKVEIESNKGAFVSGFKYGGGTDAVRYSTEDVLWLNLFDPFDPLGGVSPLEAWLKTVDSQFANAAFVEYMFKKGGAPDFLLMAKQGMSTEQKRSFRAEFRRLFGRMVGRKDTIAILSGDAKLEPLQRPPRELQSVEHEKAMLDNIAIAFGVPKSLLTSDDVNLANAREGSVTHARNTIWPMVSRFEDVVNQRLLPKWSDRLFVMHESPIKEDRSIRITERASQIASGYTINEIREADGMARFDEEWADAPMLSNSVSPAETIEEPEPAKPVTASSQSQITKANESEVDPDAVVEVKFTDTMWRDECVLGCSHEKATDDFGGEDEGSKAFTNALASVIREYLKQVIVSMKFCQHYVMKKPLVAGDDVLFFDAVDNEHIEELLMAAGDKHLSTVFFGAGSDALMTLESEYGVTVGAAFDIDTSAARKYLETTNRRMARDIPNSLQKEVRREIANGMKRGDDTDTVASKLQEMKGQWTESRAKRIARTESRYAGEAGKMEGWGQSGVVAGKEFLIAPGACPVCKAVDMQVKGKMFPIGGKMFNKGDSIKYTDDGGKSRKFMFDYTSMKGPPVHPNCRCTLIPVIGED